ncbi:MAG: sugar phosphate isomerase/epimerase [Treponema sp.]|nr:sugar phosphate isomerase/epimerase [Treponema sp.]
MLDIAVQLNFKALEFGCGNWSPAKHLNLDELLENKDKRLYFLDAIQSRGLKIEALNCSGNQLAPNDEGAVHQAVVEKTFRLAEHLGVTKIVMMSGLPGGGPGEKLPNWITTSWPMRNLDVLEWQWNDVAIPYWQKTVERAKSYGITKIALENHGFQLVYNAATLKKLRDNAGELVGMNLDPSHLFWMGGDPVSAIMDLGQAIYHVHAKDARIESYFSNINGLLDTQAIDKYKTRAWNYVAVGYGHDLLWWKTFCSRLLMAGYDGALSLEMEDQSMGQVEGVKKSVEVLIKSMPGFDDLMEKI